MIPMHRRTVARVFLLCLIAGACHAQPYPNKPVRLVHGFAAGSAIDVFSRPLARKLTELFGRQA